MWGVMSGRCPCFPLSLLLPPLIYIPTNGEEFAISCLVDQHRRRGPDTRRGKTSVAVCLGEGRRDCT